MSIVLEKAKELGDLIAQSEEMLVHQKAEKAFLADEDAQKALTEFEQTRGELMQQMRDPSLSPEQLNEVRETIRMEMIKVQENIVIRDYLTTKANFNQLIQRINSIISHCIKGEQEEEGGCSPGNCGGCQGCH